MPPPHTFVNKKSLAVDSCSLTRCLKIDGLAAANVAIPQFVVRPTRCLRTISTSIRIGFTRGVYPRHRTHLPIESSRWLGDLPDHRSPFLFERRSCSVWWCLLAQWVINRGRSHRRVGRQWREFSTTRIIYHVCLGTYGRFELVVFCSGGISRRRKPRSSCSPAAGATSVGSVPARRIRVGCLRHLRVPSVVRDDIRRCDIVGQGSIGAI